jgi:hypothetical protein
MLTNARAYVSPPPGKTPTQAEVNQLKAYISELTSALTTLNMEKDKLIAEVGDAGRTKDAANIQSQGDKMMQELTTSQSKLAQLNRKLEAELGAQVRAIEQQRNVLDSNNSAFTSYAGQIQNKMELLATRDRMLQLSQERNVYKKKVIYILFAVIIALLVAIIAAYTFFGKKRA